MKAGFGTEEYFVWSRFDGATSVRDLILIEGTVFVRGRRDDRAGFGLVCLDVHEPRPFSPTRPSGHL